MKKLFILTLLALSVLVAVPTVAEACVCSATTGQCSPPGCRPSGGTGGTSGGTLSQGRGDDLKYTPLEPIRGITTDSNGGDLNFPRLIARIYEVSIVIGALFSVLMITISGIRYMITDVVEGKAKAKQRIIACLYGLVLIAISYLILTTINPELVIFRLSPPASQGVTNNTFSSGTSGQPSTTNPPNQYTTEASCAGAGYQWSRLADGGYACRGTLSQSWDAYWPSFFTRAGQRLTDSPVRANNVNDTSLFIQGAR